MNPLTYKEAEEKILSEKSVFIQGYKHTDKPLSDFLRSLFELMDTFPTVYEDNTLQTYAKKSRSLTDIFLLTHPFYPEANLKLVRSELKKLGIVGHICPTINRRVYRLKGYVNRHNHTWELYIGNGGAINETPDYVDEFGWTWSYEPADF